MIQVELPANKQECVTASNEAVKDIRKEYGDGAIFDMRDRKGLTVPVIPTGIYSLDFNALTVGGLPQGRIIEIFGPESCLASESFIQFEIRTQQGKRVNHKGGTIETLYNRFHGKEGHEGWTKKPVEYFLSSTNEDGRIFQNKIVNVINTGQKECYLVVTEDGQKLQCTKEHKFKVEDGFKALYELKVGQEVLIHNNTPYKCEHKAAASRAHVFVKFHGVAGKKKAGKYKYYRLSKARAIVESKLNNLSYEDYITKLNNGPWENLKFLPRTQHVHHIDENPLNNDFNNLVIVDISEHGKLHATQRHNNLRYIEVKSKITSIEYVGIKQTYDIRMLSPFNNYVAEGFIVHNSGKTTLALQCISQAQSLGGLCAFVDAEHALDPMWAGTNGVNVDDLLVSQPDYGEQAIDICERLVSSGAFKVIVIDSVAALVPKAELEGDSGDSHMGLQARLMSQAMRKLSGITAKTNTIVIFINQIREKIGVMFGSPETTTGGRALKFFASVRLDVRRISSIKDGDKIIGNNVKIKVVKNKVAAPFKETEVKLFFDRGFDDVEGLIAEAVKLGIIEKSGAWYVYQGKRSQGSDKLKADIRVDELLKQVLEKRV